MWAYICYNLVKHKPLRTFTLPHYAVRFVKDDYKFRYMRVIKITDPNEYEMLVQKEEAENVKEFMQQNKKSR